MATEMLSFDQTPISILGLGVLTGEYTGALTVNYDTMQVTGTITASPALGTSFDFAKFSAFTLTKDPSGNYVLTSNGNIPGSTFTITYSGTAPSKADADLREVGFDLVSGRGGTVTSTLVPCFLRGTLIATPSGERPIEDLRTGDAVMTAAGVSKEIIWVGTRSYDQAFVAKKLWPVRIAANALGDQLPTRDLFLSPCHAVLIDGLLIPSGELINGVSITQDRPRDSIDYYHIELEEHDVVVAEGVAAETFVDDNSRMMFENASEYYELHPHREDVDALYSAVRVDDGEELEAIRERIAARASLSKVAA